jgi:hypothetical protein
MACRGQGAGGVRDRGLNILCSCVHAAAQVELERDVRLSNGAGRRHVFDAGNCRELALKWCGDRRCHSVGVCSGQRCAHLNGWILDLREIADGQREVAQNTKTCDRRDKQRGRGGAANEEVSQLHGQPYAAGASASLSRAWRIEQGNARARCEPELSFGDDGVSRTDAAADDCLCGAAGCLIRSLHRHRGNAYDA